MEFIEIKRNEAEKSAWLEKRNEWLKAELSTNIPYESVVDGEILKKVTPVITFRETRRYNEIEY